MAQLYNKPPLIYGFYFCDKRLEKKKELQIIIKQNIIQSVFIHNILHKLYANETRESAFAEALLLEQSQRCPDITGAYITIVRESKSVSRLPTHISTSLAYMFQ